MLRLSFTAVAMEVVVVVRIKANSMDLEDDTMSMWKRSTLDGIAAGVLWESVDWAF